MLFGYLESSHSSPHYIACKLGQLSATLCFIHVKKLLKKTKNEVF